MSRICGRSPYSPAFDRSSTAISANSRSRTGPKPAWLGNTSSMPTGSGASSTCPCREIFSACSTKQGWIFRCRPSRAEPVSRAARAADCSQCTPATPSSRNLCRNVQGRTRAPEKVGGYLLVLAKRLGSPDEAIDLPITRYHIADHLGIAVETMCRAITDLRRAGAIDFRSPRTISILDSLSVRTDR